MKRRDLLATVAATSAGAGCSGRLLRSKSESREPIAVETIDAPGSHAGTATVPAPDRVSFVEFFATTCSTCAAQMPSLREAYRAVGGQVQFLSVTSQPVGLTLSRTELADWWADHGGTWPVAVDDGTALARRYGATTLPTAVVVRPDGSVAWSHHGALEATTIVDAVRAALADAESTA